MFKAFLEKLKRALNGMCDNTIQSDFFATDRNKSHSHVNRG